MAGASLNVLCASDNVGGLYLDGVASFSYNGESYRVGANDLTFVREVYRPRSPITTIDLVSVDSCSSSDFTSAASSFQTGSNWTVFTQLNAETDERVCYLAYYKPLDLVITKTAVPSNTNLYRCVQDFLNSDLYSQLSGGSEDSRGKVKFTPLVSLNGFQKAILNLIIKFLVVAVSIGIILIITRIAYVAAFGKLHVTNYTIKKGQTLLWSDRKGGPGRVYRVYDETGAHVRNFRSYADAVAFKELNDGMRYRTFDEII